MAPRGIWQRCPSSFNVSEVAAFESASEGKDRKDALQCSIIDFQPVRFLHTRILLACLPFALISARAIYVARPSPNSLASQRLAKLQYL